MILDKEYNIIADSEGVILQHTVTTEVTDKESGEKVTKTKVNSFYYPHVEAALRKYVREKPKHCKTIDEVLAKLDMIHEDIKTLKSKP